MMNDLQKAFDELKSAKAEATTQEGETPQRELIFLNGRRIEALVSEITIDEENVSGGIAKAGGFRCQIAVADVAGKPEKFTEISVRGHKFQVLQPVTEVNGVTYEIQTGDPMSGQR